MQIKGLREIKIEKSAPIEYVNIKLRINQVAEPESRPDPFRENTEQRAADFEVDRRLTAHLAANAVKVTPSAAGTLQPNGTSLIMQWLALVALIPLLAIAWVYSALYDRSQ